MDFQLGGSRGEALAQTMLNCGQQPEMLACTPSVTANRT